MEAIESINNVEEYKRIFLLLLLLSRLCFKHGSSIYQVSEARLCVYKYLTKHTYIMKIICLMPTAWLRILQTVVFIVQRNIHEKLKILNVHYPTTNVDILGHVVIFTEGSLWSHHAYFSYLFLWIFHLSRLTLKNVLRSVETDFKKRVEIETLDRDHVKTNWYPHAYFALLTFFSEFFVCHVRIFSETLHVVTKDGRIRGWMGGPVAWSHQSQN